ncbi:MAG: phosphoribosylanthranilate isomerase [Pseudomonadota bacterium]
MALETVKICGLSTVGSVQQAVSGGASHLGFIFFPKSPRNVTPEQAASLVAHAGGRQTVAVTVNADDTFLDAIDRTMQPHIHQLHGAETPQHVETVKTRYGKPVMKAMAIRSQDDLTKLKAYDGIADLLLLDAKPPAGSDLPGGNGVTFDWDLVAGLNTATPVLLSGGIDLENLGLAKSLVSDASNSLMGIDVSSGVEAKPGVKDTVKIQDFLVCCRA